MMAPHGGGRPGSSRRVRLVPVRQSGMDHRAVARGLARARGGEVRLLPRTPDGATQGAVFRLELPFRPTGRDRSADSAAPHPR